MIIDILSEFSDDQDGGAFAVGVNASTNILDTEIANSNYGEGEPLILRVSVGDEAITSAGDATVQAVLEESADNSTWTTLMAGVAIAKASLTKGVVMFEGPVPFANKRYLRVSYTVAVADLTAGYFNAHIGIG